MNSKTPTAGKSLLPDYGLTALLVFTAGGSLTAALRMHQSYETVTVLWLLAAGMSAATLWHHFKTGTVNPPDTILSWLLLLSAGVTLLLSAFLNNPPVLQLGLLLLLAACLARFTAYQEVFKMLPALAIFLLLLPNADYFNSLMSYPLRLICSYLTCFTLKAFGLRVGCEATVLKFGNEEIAVTAACSGINQLEAMFLIGWIIVMLTHKRLACRVSHWLLLLPLVIVFNSLRLTITLLLYSTWGQAALSNNVHNILGYLMVFAVALVFYLCRRLIPFSEKQTGTVKSCMKKMKR
ncbi:MAG: exosortase/archaeosortase family protein [Victivallales bacterium]|nr:exosortase/archaeosortase family protein [Victivallales bacterium]